MKKRIYYVSRDPAHLEWWFVSSAAMPAMSFENRHDAVQWATERASEDGAADYDVAQVLVQGPQDQWTCVHDAAPAPHRRSSAQ